ncbi:leucine-rich repeat domain-containing protein [Flavobacterium oncorhynchi]|uniref:leucine-rich repeat domain-containing protein n=1 Tax=Flavobacterium oncorhynchi TaxID=728056 RepID=UPI00351A5169
MKINKIPDNKSISKLDLSNSNLKSIPAEVFKLKNLRTLNLSNNSIKDIPKEISELKSLEVLDISNNKISNFFAKLCELKKLHTLNLNNNQITSVPKQICKLQRLRKFYLANNKIKTLPEEFSKLNNLVAVNLSKNPIIELPDSLLSLFNLKQLWICNIPFENAKLKNIQQQLTNLKAIYAYSKFEKVTTLDTDYDRFSKNKGNSIKLLHKISEDLVSIKPKKVKLQKNKIIHQHMIEVQKSSLFISYSHKDKEWLNRVQTHLKVLNHQNDVELNVWDDTKILAGEKWKEEIAKALKNAKVAILIISTDFLASDFIQSSELPDLLNNANENGTKLLSLIVKPCRFKHQAGLNDLQALNDPSMPLSKMSDSDQEEILVKLTDRIEQLIQK